MSPFLAKGSAVLPYFTIAAEGVAPLLMHSATLADPLDEFAKEIKRISSNKSKTEADHHAMGEAEFMGGLYYLDDVGPYVPGQNLHACLVAGAKKKKNGTKVKQAVFIETAVNPLTYEGPTVMKELLADPRFRNRTSVKVGMSRVMRTRPQFAPPWSLQARAYFDPEEIDFDQLEEAWDACGRLIGLGDWRPFYGRFRGQLTLETA